MVVVEIVDAKDLTSPLLAFLMILSRYNSTYQLLHTRLLVVNPFYYCGAEENKTIKETS